MFVEQLQAALHHSVVIEHATGVRGEMCHAGHSDQSKPCPGVCAEPNAGALSALSASAFGPLVLDGAEQVNRVAEEMQAELVDCLDIAHLLRPASPDVEEARWPPRSHPLARTRMISPASRARLRGS